MAIGVSKHGSQLVTSSVEIGISGSSKYIYGMHILSGAVAGLVKLRNGTSGSATIYIQVAGTGNSGLHVSFVEGVFFPAGCYVDMDASTTSVLMSYSENAQ